MIEPITIDYETHAIVGNPIVNPPRPVGCAIWLPGSDPEYYAWGHGSGNNVKYADFHDYLRQIHASGRPRLYHNASFDISVQNRAFCNALTDWRNEGWRLVHDTQYLLFLADPYATTFSLKPSAERWLGMAPTEQSDLKRWILANVAEATPDTFGAYIARAPVELVAPYAIGDVVRTRRLFDLLYAKIVSDGMEAAYDRERRLLPVLLQGTERGIRIDRDLLERDSAVLERSLATANSRICQALGADDSIFESTELLCDALERAGAVKEWVLTPTGKRSTAKDNIRIADPYLKNLLAYRANALTCLQTFMRPWIVKSASDGRLHPNWNQVRQPRGEKFSKGTRTGRLSSDDPNFQNVPTEFTDRFGVPLPVPDGCTPLPMLRQYCLPEVGHVWLKRDYSSQEIRILAHFEDGSLAQAYIANPSMDPHKMARGIIEQMTGLLYERTQVKITGFSIIYGSGAPGLAGQLGSTVEAAREIKSAYLNAMPGIRDLMYDISARGKRGDAIRTWGGRLYVSEPAKIINGSWRTFEYKLLNYLIQGSAADQTKEAICDWEDARRWDAVFLATVHDEINISTPADAAAVHMQTLREAMERPRLDVPTLSEGFQGPNWQDITECD